MKLFTKTFGCQMNFADSDEMGRHLADRGFTSTDDHAAADAILVNTCTVRDLAEHKAASYIGRLREWKQGRSERFIIVTGCAAERAKADLKHRFPYVDLIVGAKEIETFPKTLDEFLNRHSRMSQSGIHGSPIKTFGDDGGKSVQYVTTMRGCNYSCSYCIVPAVRGREVYLPVVDILKETENRVREGAKEIWLLGQTVNSYKPAQPPKPGYDFSDLLRDVSAVPGVERIRFMSPHPFYLTPKLIQAMAETKQVCEHMHLPAQSGSNAMLKKMRRNYTRESYLANVNALRRLIPDIVITTDLIVGFPGESEDDFQATLSLVEEAAFDSAYCFKYSPRPGTESASWEDDISAELKEERVNRLLEITEAKGREKVEKLIGTVQEVLIEDDKGGGLYRGKTRGSWRARIQDPTLKIGQIVEARITGSHSRELHAEVLKNVSISST